MKKISLLPVLLALLFVSGCFSVFPKKQQPPPAYRNILPTQNNPATTESPAISKKEKALLKKAEKEKAKKEKLALQKNSKRKGWKEMLFFWWPKSKPAPPAATPLNPIASIYVVNGPGKFVVLDSPSSNQLQTGKVLNTMKNGVIESTLRVTDDRTPPFIVAEIVSGSPSRGDSVFILEP